MNPTIGSRWRCLSSRAIYTVTAAHPNGTVTITTEEAAFPVTRVVEAAFLVGAYALV